MNYNLINGAFEAKLPGLTKLVLLGMLWHRNDQTGRVWVSQETLAKELGISYNTVARAVDKLEELKVLVYIGEMPLNPGNVGRSTHIYEIDLKPLGFVPSEVTIRPISTLRGHQSRDLYPERVPKEIQSAGGVGVGVSAQQSGGSERTHAYTHTHTHSDALVDETPYGVDQDQNQQQPLRLSEEEIPILVSIFTHLTGVEDSDSTESLRSYSGPLTSARLALLMYYAFRISKYWSLHEKWDSVDMDNFLGASRKLDGEFRTPAWRQADKVAKRLPTAQAVLDHLVPPACAKGGHEWEDIHFPTILNWDSGKFEESGVVTTQQCRTCGKFRAHPQITSWTAADELEAEYHDGLKRSAFEIEED